MKLPDTLKEMQRNVRAEILSLELDLDKQIDLLIKKQSRNAGRKKGSKMLTYLKEFCSLHKWNYDKYLNWCDKHNYPAYNLKSIQNEYSHIIRPKN